MGFGEYPRTPMGIMDVHWERFCKVNIDVISCASLYISLCLFISRLRPRCWPPWVLACWIFVVCSYFAKCLCVCWLAGFWMWVSRSLFSNDHDFLANAVIFVVFVFLLFLFVLLRFWKIGEISFIMEIGNRIWFRRHLCTGSDLLTWGRLVARSRAMLVHLEQLSRALTRQRYGK